MPSKQTDSCCINALISDLVLYIGFAIKTQFTKGLEKMEEKTRRHGDRAARHRILIQLKNRMRNGKRIRANKLKQKVEWLRKFQLKTDFSKNADVLGGFVCNRALLLPSQCAALNERRPKLTLNYPEMLFFGNCADSAHLLPSIGMVENTKYNSLNWKTNLKTHISEGLYKNNIKLQIRVAAKNTTWFLNRFVFISFFSPLEWRWKKRWRLEIARMITI